MESLHNIVRRGEAMNRDDLISLLSLTEAEDLEILYRAAYETKVPENFECPLCGVGKDSFESA